MGRTVSAVVWLPSLGQIVWWTVKAVGVAAAVGGVAFVLAARTGRGWNQ